MKILLWEIRTGMGLTLEKVEKITGISDSTLHRIESGLTSPTLNQLKIISEALGVRINDLFWDENQ